ncbi:zinc finger protein 79-like [Contarinia nasturtii]|uniref:zinc finger protein 79-like n=1 Tax=Contarinia nasturtii TaxID=265458 RepID=UPI0012D40599|nr:zinc finger protein 79-like [Contarinia nasturtii]
MNPYQSKGKYCGKIKRKCKCNLSATKVTVKKEVVVKEEYTDGIELIHYPLPASPIGAKVAIKSQSENDSEMEPVKKEIKCEDECLTKKCEKEEDGFSKAEANKDESFGGNASGPSPKLNSKGANRKRKSDRKENKATKKDRKGKVSKKPVANERKKHKCHLCDYASSRKPNVTIYIRTDTGEKPFECEICAKNFTTKGNLIRHKKIHITEFPFSCSKCGCRFTEETEKINHENACKVHQ